jgi:hypothetical protein
MDAPDAFLQDLKSNFNEEELSQISATIRQTIAEKELIRSSAVTMAVKFL